MNCQTLATIVIAFALGAPAAFGQVTSIYKADIPFDFSVGRKTLPAGEYEIRNDPATGVVRLRSSDFRHAAVAMTFGADRDPARIPVLRFSRYGTQAFLSEFQPGDAPGRKLKLSPGEKELLAKVKANTNTVVVASGR